MTQSKKRTFSLHLDIWICLLILAGLFFFSLSRDKSTPPPTATALETVQAFAEKNHLTLSDYPESLLALLSRNPETEQFVLQYPLKKDGLPVIDLSDMKDCQQVPLLLQWDQRWGYTKYGSDFMGITGCGPTTLSMVAIYLTGDTSLDPLTVADFARKNGYCVPGSGSSWTLISEGGPLLGLSVEEVPLDEGILTRTLANGTPVVAVMGPGDFTDDGHFLVLTGIKDGKITLNDPNSPQRSETLWDYDTLKDQILVLWACSK